MFRRAGLVAAVTLAMATPAWSQISPQTDAPQDHPATTLEDVTVTGETLAERVESFVDQTSAPSRGRGLARWHDDICVGVANLRRDAAQPIVDRISQVALRLGLRPGDPGCRSNILVLFTDDGGGMARMLAERHHRAFQVGVAGLDRSEAAFAGFVGDDRPVRWWHTSMPVNADTGARAIRLPGDDRAPAIRIHAASRLNTQIRDDLRKAVVIVDVDAAAAINATQLADYIAMVALSQVNPEGDYARHDSILAVFDDPDRALEGLTDWDWSYLSSLYRVLDAPQLPVRANGQAFRVSGAMLRDQARRDADRDAAPNP